MLNIFDGFFTNSINKIILSRGKSNTNQYKKIVITLKDDKYFVEQFTQKQVFHLNLDFVKTKEFCITQLKENFNQLNAFDDNFEYSVLISKKGKITFLKKKSPISMQASLSKGNTNNRQKNYIIKEGEIIPPLVDMGIFTQDGKVVNSMYDKFKQINRFIEIVDDVIKDDIKELNIIDFGCGKSYLTFILYYYLTFIKEIKANIIGLDLKEDVIKKCNIASEKYGYENLKFELGDINGYNAPFDVNMVISLHACDTATDYALYNAIKWDADIILSVPCCQHELNEQFRPKELEIFSEYGIIQERVCGLVTDAVRGNLLKYSGYKTQVMEFVDLSHTPKNLLIRAVKSKIDDKKKKQSIEQVEEVINKFDVKPTLYELLT